MCKSQTKELNISDWENRKEFDLINNAKLTVFKKGSYCGLKVKQNLRYYFGCLCEMYMYVVVCVRD